MSAPMSQAPGAPMQYEALRIQHSDQVCGAFAAQQLVDAIDAGEFSTCTKRDSLTDLRSSLLSWSSMARRDQHAANALRHLADECLSLILDRGRSNPASWCDRPSVQAMLRALRAQAASVAMLLNDAEQHTLQAIRAVEQHGPSEPAAEKLLSKSATRRLRATRRRLARRRP